MSDDKRFLMTPDFEESDRVKRVGDVWYLIGSGGDDTPADVMPLHKKGWAPVGFANDVPATFRKGKP